MIMKDNKMSKPKLGYPEDSPKKAELLSALASELISEDTLLEELISFVGKDRLIEDLIQYSIDEDDAADILSIFEIYQGDE